MTGIGTKVLGLVLLGCMAVAPIACTTINTPPDNKSRSKTEVNVNKEPDGHHGKTEVNVRD